MASSPPCLVPALYASRLYKHVHISSPARFDVAFFGVVYALLAIIPIANLAGFGEQPLDDDLGTGSSDLIPKAISATLNATSPDSVSTASVLASIDSWSAFSTMYTLFCILVVLSHTFLVLLCNWSTRVLCLVRFRSASNTQSATHIAVQATPTSSWELIEILGSKESPSFTYQHRKFVWSSDKNAFVELDFPINNPRQYYLQYQGLGHDDDHMFIERVKYGLNAFDVPLPSFQSLFAEHATAPFFVFQMFCVGLWLLDEYWYYSLMTLCMLVLFEMSVVKRRLVSLEQVRNMRAAPYDVSVYRSGRWRTVSTRDLLPGDLLSLRRYPSGSGHHVPCDVVLIKGSCVVDESLLTGESVPQLKEPLSNSGMLSDPLDIAGPDKCHILFGGTQIIIHSSPSEGRRPPDDGAIGYVLRTGFHTSQGRLISTMVSSTERVTVNNAEAFLFIMLLLMFAVTAAAYVLMQSWNDPNRSRSKLLLNCIMIITSVVPPELPMELSLAVNVSLAALIRKRIFCTEPFRIPFAGGVDTVCFDKTGTLTEDKFEFLGVVSEPDSKSNGSPKKQGDKGCDRACMPLQEEVDPASPACRIIGSCHSLVHLEGRIVGDPLETAAVQACEWQTVSANGTGINVLRNSKSRETIRITRRFPFDSVLRRMACVVTVNNQETYAVCKGAPEAVLKLLGNIPAYYEATHRHYSREGHRVLAMSYKLLQSSPITEGAALKISRSEVESNLIFAGFMVLDSPMKVCSLDAVRSLQSSSHFVLMITGDHALTACNVSAKLNIVSGSNPTYILSNLTINNTSKQLTWVPVSDTLPNIAYKPKQFPVNANFCVTGPALQAIKSNADRAAVILKARVFARVNPEQKQLIINILKEQGRITMMCGDGTNDVGALKHSHVGVALLTGDRDTQTEHKKLKPAKTVDRSGRARRQEMLDSFDDGPQVVSLGDASVAAPFTAKRSEVNCCLDIIRQGRCTLVTTMQMYQILALQCLISAYSLSVLYLDGVKLGDTQMTVTGILVALMFLFISRAQPVHTLSPERPQSSVFAIGTLLSIFGQFVIHLSSLIAAVQWCQPFRSMTTDIDSDFSPNVLNTVVYLVSTSMTLATFASNYKGRPFMQSITENKALWRCIVGSFIGVLCLCLEISPAVNEALGLHPFPNSSLQTSLALLMISDFCGSVLLEYVVNKIALMTSKLKVS